MNADEIVRALKEMLPPQVDYAELVCSPVPSSYGVCYVWENPEPYHISAAIDLIESLQAQLAAKSREIERLYGEAETNHKIHVALTEDYYALQAQLAASQRRERAAVEDIAMAHKHGLCEVCGRMPHCLMSLNHGCGAEEGTVCDGDKWEWRGNAE